LIPRVTWRGSLALYTLAVLAVFYTLTRDPILALPIPVLALTLAVDLALLYASTRRQCTAKPGETTVRVTLGDSKPLGVELDCGRVVEVKASGYASVENFKVGSSASVTLSIRGVHVGLHRLQPLSVRVASPLGLFTVSRSTPIDVTVKVTPRFVALLLYAYGLLAGRAGPEYEGFEYELFRWIASRGYGEYRYTREYSPGDDLKRLDWKATARTLKLMVKDFSSVSRAGVLAVDLRCAGLHTCDNLLSALLSIAIAYYLEASPAYIYELDRGERLSLDPEGVLRYAISRALEPSIASRLELYEYIQPATLEELRALARIPLRSKVTPATEGGALTAISPLVVGGRELLDIVSKHRGRGVEVYVVTPRSPWLDALDVEEAYSIYQTVRNIVAKLESLGAVVYSCCPPRRVTSRSL